MLICRPYWMSKFLQNLKNIKFSRSYSLRRKIRVSLYIGKSLYNKNLVKLQLKFWWKWQGYWNIHWNSPIFFWGILYRCIKNDHCDFIWFWFFFFRPAEIEKILKNVKTQPFLAFYGLKNGSKIKIKKSQLQFFLNHPRITHANF